MSTSTNPVKNESTNRERRTKRTCGLTLEAVTAKVEYHNERIKLLEAELKDATACAAAAEEKKEQKRLAGERERNKRKKSVIAMNTTNSHGSKSAAGGSSPKQFVVEVKYKSKLPPEELEKLTERLTRPVHGGHPILDASDLPPIVERKEIGSESVEALVARLGEDDVMMRRSKQDTALETTLNSSYLAVKSAEAAKLEPDEVEALGIRLSRTSIVKRNEKVEKLRQELLESALAGGVHNRKCDQDEEEEDHDGASGGEDAVERCYGRSMDSKKRVKEEIFAKYVVPLAPTGKLTKETQNAMADRLSTVIRQ